MEKIVLSIKIKYSLYFILLALFLVAPTLRGQPLLLVQNKIDSLHSLYEKANNDTTQLYYFTRMARVHRYINLDSSKFLLKKAIQLHKEKKVDNRTHALAYNVIADIYKLEQKMDSALFYYEEAYQLFSTIEDPIPFLAIAPPFGNTLVKNNEITRGIEILQEGIQIATINNDYDNLSFLYAYLGNIMLNVQKDYKRARIIFQKGIDASKRIHNDTINFNRVNATLNIGLAELFIKEMKKDSAIIFAKKSVNQALNANYFQKALIANNLLSQIYIEKNQLEIAEQFSETAISLFSEVKDLKAMANTQILSLSILLRLNKLEQGITLGNSIFKNFGQSLDSEMKEKIYNQLFEAYIKLGEEDNILKIKDSLLFYTHQSFDEENTSLLAKMYDETLYKQQKSENQLLLVQQKAAKKQLAIQKLAAIGLIIALFFAIAWAITSYRLYKQKNKQSITLEKVVNERTQELKKVNEELVQANYELRALTYIASHDLKEPMRNIGNYIFLIKRKLPETILPKFESDFSFIKKSLSRLYTLIEGYTQYINFSKSDLILSEKVDLNLLLDDVKKDLKLKIDFEDTQIQNSNLTFINSNRSALYFIFKNLIENGLKYNKSNVPLIEISQKETESEINISFKDNGIGIAQEYKEKIFDMYKRLHHQTEYDGSGLGLSIARVLTKKINGNIDVESTPQNGSIFTLTIPKG